MIAAILAAQAIDGCSFRPPYPAVLAQTPTGAIILLLEGKDQKGNLVPVRVDEQGRVVLSPEQAPQNVYVVNQPSQPSQQPR